MPLQNHKCEMAIQRQQHFADQYKLPASRNRNETKKTELDWSFTCKTSIEYNQRSAAMESTREKRKAQENPGNETRRLK